MATRRFARLACVITALVLSACDGNGGTEAGSVRPRGDIGVSDPAATEAAAGTPEEPTAAAGTPEEPTAAARTPEVLTPNAELPAFLNDFSRVCTTQVGFPGAAPYDKEPGAHPIVLFEEHGADSTLLETSRDLPQAWVIEQDDDFEDNAELAGVELIGCSDRRAERPNGSTCEFDSDGEPVTFDLVDARYVLTVYEAKTGEKLGSARLKAQNTDCPAFLSFQEGETKIFNAPSDDQIINAIRPFVDP